VQVVSGDNTWVAGQFEGVAAQIASIEVVQAYAANDGERIPFAARAVARDADGGLVYGLPVAWKVTEGALAIEPGADPLPGLDYALLRDACDPPPEDGAENRTATIEARYGSVSGSASLRWEVRVPAEPPDPFQPDAFCQRASPLGCGCGASGPVPAAWLVIAVLAAIRSRGRPR
jgi:hypothetical protein